MIEDRSDDDLRRIEADGRLRGENEQKSFLECLYYGRRALYTIGRQDGYMAGLKDADSKANRIAGDDDKIQPPTRIGELAFGAFNGGGYWDGVLAAVQSRWQSMAAMVWRRAVANERATREWIEDPKPAGNAALAKIVEARTESFNEGLTHGAEAERERITKRLGPLGVLVTAEAITCNRVRFKIIADGARVDVMPVYDEDRDAGQDGIASDAPCCAGDVVPIEDRVVHGVARGSSRRLRLDARAMSALDDYAIPNRAQVDDRGVSKLAIEWWGAYSIRRAVEIDKDLGSDRATERLKVARSLGRKMARAQRSKRGVGLRGPDRKAQRPPQRKV